jgi:hypothetical protein
MQMENKQKNLLKNKVFLKYNPQKKEIARFPFFVLVTKFKNLFPVFGRPLFLKHQLHPNNYFY